jgi:hypothetical protein
MPEKADRIDEATYADGFTPKHSGGTIMISRYAEAVRARVEEVQTRSDFDHMADLIDRGVMAGFQSEQVPTTFQTLGYRRDTVDLAGAHGGYRRDYTIDAVRTIPKVAEKGEYKPIDAEESQFDFRTYKYGCQWDISWEAYLRDNRDLGLLMRHPTNWGLSARYTQQVEFTTAYAGNLTYFTAARGNYDDGGDTALDEDSLDAALTMFQEMTDQSGNLVPYAGRIFLVVPPVLERTARQLLNATFSLNGAAVELSNLVNNTCELVVDPFLPSVDTTQGDTAWYLFADPSLRPAVRYGFLQGYDQPEIFVKASEVQGLFSGEEDPFAGSFLSDDIEFKLRFTFGADTVDPGYDSFPFGAIMMKGKA